MNITRGVKAVNKKQVFHKGAIPFVFIDCLGISPPLEAEITSSGIKPFLDTPGILEGFISKYFADLT